MRRPLLLTAIIAFVVTVSEAQTPVWSTDVAPILYNNCASCHRSDGIAPFSLITYNEAVTYSTAISANVQSRNMPPWPPDPSFNRLAHERLLSIQEINKIVDWVNAGTPQGDPNLAPPPPVFNNNGELPGTPDLIAKIPPYTSTAATGDVYQCFVVPSGVSVEKFITAFEAIPGNRPVVHHVLVYADTTGICAGKDVSEPGPGYTSFGGVGTNSAILLGGWVPGTQPLKFPGGFGVRLPKNSDIVIQIHYPAGSAGEKDSTEIHFFFSPTPVRSVFIDPVLNHLTNISEPLFIPANQTKTFTEEYVVPPIFNASILGVAPHMHLIGKYIDAFAVTPANDTIEFIRIKNWDFHWQGFYLFRKFLKVPGGSTLYSNAFYDNTTNNPLNPSNPPKNVSAGEATTDEMMLTYFIWTFYQSGDENIVIDTSTPVFLSAANYYKGETLFEPYPNPASNELVVKYYFEKPETGSIDIIDMQGKTVKQLMMNEKNTSGYTARKYSVADLPSGMYTLRLRTSERTLNKKLVIQH